MPTVRAHAPVVLSLVAVLVCANALESASAVPLRHQRHVRGAPRRWESPAEAVTCETNSYPPPTNTTIPTFTISLDAAPQDRWTAIAKQHTVPLKALVGHIVDLVPKLFKGALLDLLNKDLAPVADELPKPYGDEIKGIAAATGVPLGELVLYNIFYSIFSVCTSIVAQDSQGEVYHARNLDFGLFMGYDWKNHTWDVTELLRPLMVNVEWTKGGNLDFVSTHYVGYVGVLTGLRPGVFSVTVDERFDDKFDSGLIAWLRGDHSASWLTLMIRDAIETATTYEEAFDKFNKTKLIAPAYLIMSGPKTGQGAIITRERDAALNVWTLESRLQAGSFYLLETNYDHWKKVPFFDDRRGPGMQCMNATGADNISLPTLFNVLDTKPVKNQLTTYSVLMHVKSGKYETYRKRCPPPCSPW